ncbi:hypothetical protein SAMN05660742_11035 [Propionispira arboris]|uniref:Uncharacterized protein n=1 Tax=Propionispira arboris TaxID=84035 RepID=A0A1H6ZN85_9FIRM|nr:hypothetical protein [Propionispira arboris]SEJ54879.1 hypothetical protein SAMN05660742_11035 [Propionispira arboris]
MFVLEKQMTPILTNSLKHLSAALSESIECSSSALALEFPVKYRIIDVAIAYALPDFLTNDISTLKCFKYLNGFSIGILSQFWLYNKVSIQKLQNELFLDQKVIEKYVSKLLKCNLITQVSKNSYTATELKSLKELGLISIELKLYNWKEALEQAEFNLLFSDFSFVALDKSRISDKNDILPFFKKKNIGLLVVSNNGAIEPLFTPKKNKKYDKNLYVSQRIKIIQGLALQQKWHTIQTIL